MERKKILIAVALLSLVVVGFAATQWRSYSIPSMDIDLFLDGKIHVKETIHYSFKGTWHGINRKILDDNQSIENLNVSECAWRIL